MFDIYSLAKPRVFMAKPHDGGGSGTDEEKSAPELVSNEQKTLSVSVHLVSENDPGYPEGAGRKYVGASLASPKAATINVLNALNDLGGRATAVFNKPRTILKNTTFRNEFRPKDGTHNLDFTTPSETPSDNPGGDAPAQ